MFNKFSAHYISTQHDLTISENESHTHVPYRYTETPKEHFCDSQWLHRQKPEAS